MSHLRTPLGWLLFLLAISVPIPTSFLFAQKVEQPQADLSQDLAPWLNCLLGRSDQFSLSFQATPVIDGKKQAITVNVRRFDGESFDLQVSHSDYAIDLRRRQEGLALALPKHGVVFVGEGKLEQSDLLRPQDIHKQLLSTGTALKMYVQLLQNTPANDLSTLLVSLARIGYRPEDKAWLISDDIEFFFGSDHRSCHGTIKGIGFEAKLNDPSEPATDYRMWEGYRQEVLPRAELEGQLCRGVRRGLEILLPSLQLTNPNQKARTVPHGELLWVDGQRVALLHGSPSEIGQAHGKLLKEESIRCVDSVLNTFGTAQTIATGRWFRHDLAKAYARLAPNIPQAHLEEADALADALGLDRATVQAVNVFPELFHCSGFAAFGKATKDGKLYHGRVLDYMTTIGLQDACTNLVIAVDGKIPFVNVGYAGFIGSVSGMNAEKISLGEMGGRGEGQWDGVPMATLMRRALEECDSLDEVKALWQNNPRTCEYYYVFADGETRSAVGVAATPEKVEFVAPGQGHPLLGEGIEDVVVLSAGKRLEDLRGRIVEKYGSIDASVGQWLMSRPVAMDSNLHNVLFVPEDGMLYVANASHDQPAADRPYAKLDLQELLKKVSDKRKPSVEVALGNQYPAIDSLAVGSEASEDALACLSGLTWKPTNFTVQIEKAESKKGDWLVRFPSALPIGEPQNDMVAMEWYQAKNKDGKVIVAPAAVIVHESGRGMTVGRLIAQALARKGIHALMIQLPFYGHRRSETNRPNGLQVVAAMRQGIADARRARDAVAVLPGIDTSRISLQGTSLGGFVTATTAGLDQGYHRVFILLAGGGLYDVLMDGKKDAVKLREEFEKAGVSPSDMRTMLDSIEPLRLAHRIPAKTTWLYSGKFDDVVPLLLP